MKRLLFFIFTVVLAIFCLIGCDIIFSPKYEGDLTVTPSDGVFKYKLNEDNVSYTVIGLKEDRAESIAIPEIFNDMPVTAIGNSAFENSSITGVKISSSIKSIGAHAFALCGNLSDVSFSGDDIKLGSFAFSFTNLVSIELPEGVTVIESYVFSNCENLAEVKLPKSLTEIGNAAFSRCENLEKIVIPSSVEKIGSCAFEKTSLAYIFIPESVTELSISAFQLSENFTGITVDEKNPVYKSVDGVLYSKDGKTLLIYPQSKSEEEFVVPDGVTKIGNSSFCQAIYLKSIVFSEGVTDIGSGAFSSCHSLCNVQFSNSVKTIRAEAFARCPYLEKIVIGNGVTYIEKSAFESCSRLQTVIIGDNVEKIYDRAFALTFDLSLVVIPESVKRIGTNAFGGCPAMEKIFFKGSADAWAAMPVTPDCGDGLVSVAVYFFSENQPEVDGNFWHYNAEGDPVCW